MKIYDFLLFKFIGIYIPKPIHQKEDNSEKKMNKNYDNNKNQIYPYLHLKIYKKFSSVLVDQNVDQARN